MPIAVAVKNNIGRLFVMIGWRRGRLVLVNKLQYIAILTLKKDGGTTERTLGRRRGREVVGRQAAASHCAPPLPSGPRIRSPVPVSSLLVEGET